MKEQKKQRKWLGIRWFFLVIGSTTIMNWQMKDLPETIAFFIGAGSVLFFIILQRMRESDLK
ncbi:hypothetical protein LCGC14_0912240 [marine sediment metagenome]|uniref:Uncharacterized protein n=1 Tax=marine sediment metagenome TaxID=412755 RepID=A0A0F9PE15_9ZZZZ